MAKTITSPIHSVAIIGMGCVYPGAHTPEELWQNVLAGRRFFRKIPLERLPLADYFDADPKIPGKTYCDQMAVITDWIFDPLAYGVPPVTMEASDLTHWLALSTSVAAVNDANLNLEDLDQTRIEVVLGNTMAGEFSRSHSLRFRWPYVERAIRRAWSNTGYGIQQLDDLISAVKHYYEGPLPEITEDTLAGCMSNTIAGRICNHFGLGGGGYVVDGACSSSLLAVATACDHLICGNTDLALAGGVDISLDPFEIIGFAKAQALASDDIFPYDSRAAGMLLGEGCGILILVREEDARAAGYRIYALIRGWSNSSDGRGGITAPEVEGQVRALRRTYQHAGYPLSTVDLIEGHGTGTTLGDRVEISAILQLLNESSGKKVTRIGSIKGNIGHCKAAAGAAGLIKAIMALNRKIYPPTVNCRYPNPAFGKPSNHLRPIVRGEVWEASDTPRRASVSAMGFGGSNCHITLEEANPQAVPSDDDLALLGSYQLSELILLSAESRQELSTVVESLIPIADRICRAELIDLAAALSKVNQADDIRLAIVAESPWHLAECLRLISRRLCKGESIEALGEPTPGIFAGFPQDNPSLVGLFPGQGSQRLNMGEAVLQRYPFVRDIYQLAEETVADLLPNGLRSQIECTLGIGDDTILRNRRAELQDTRVAQPAVVVSSLAMLRVMEFLGLKPDVSIGHSIGEISALCAGGAYDIETALRIAALRGKVIASLPLKDCGAMAALAAPPAEVQELIRPFSSALTIANYNSPKQTVVSGTSNSIEEIVRICKEKEIACHQLPVSHAFHSSIVAPAGDALYDALGSVSFKPLSKSVISTLTGHELDRDANLRELMANHISHPVRFTNAILTTQARRPALWVEIGPGSILTSLVHNIVGMDQPECLPTDVEGEDSFHLLNNILARAYVFGFPVSIDRLFSYRFHRPFPLSNYRPKFIVNPCEQSVQALSHSHPTQSPTPQLAPRDKEGGLSHTQVAGVGDDVGDTIDDTESLLAFAVAWIARRTGFPETYITTHAKLRDDLNLDSIKAAQLVLLLSQKLRRKMPDDPARLANVSLGQVVEAVIGASVAESQAKQERESGRTLLDLRVNSLHPWVRTFRMKEIASPLKDSTPLQLPTSGFAAIVAERGCSQAQAIASRLRDDGLIPIITDANSLFKHRKALDNLAVLVVILPQTNERFLDCSPSEFNHRVEGMSSTLFLTLGWVIHWRESELDDLPCLVLRPVLQPEDPGLDLDAGGAFLKSLQLEYPRANLKWVRLPTAWSPDRWAEVAVQELSTSDYRVMFEYDPSGLRTTSIAVPINHSNEQPPSLGATDVLLATGGAKGITSELAFGLARHTGVKLALLGSSPKPDSQASASENEMIQNFQRLDREGIQYMYVQCDVTDLKAVRHAVTQIQRKLGPVKGILHGAGVNDLRQFRDMNMNSYLHCIRVKTRGLYNLLSAIPANQLKALHVISSVLGKTGMRSQADYSLANAWLDGALQTVSAVYPQLTCLSLGYSVWAETGISKKLDVLFDLLLATGVTAISVEDGVAAYLDLVRHPQPSSTFVITGRLTPELESTLFAHMGTPCGRYLERILRWIPGTEIVAEASLSHCTDLYLPEHIFEGTAVFPGAMAVEAMAEAAMACTGAEELRVARNLRFQRPLIVPEGATISVRTLALAERVSQDEICVQVVMRSEIDGFEANHFEAEFVFGSAIPNPVALPSFPPLPEPLSNDPENYSPVPLFQGKLFRRIATIYKLEQGEASITKVRVPDGARYYSDPHEQYLVTGSPAARDAFLQSGALVLPPRYLPVSVEESHMYLKPNAGSDLICHTEVVAKSVDEFVANIAVFTPNGQLVETISGIVLRAPVAKALASTRRAPLPIPCSQVESDLQTLLPQVPFTLAVVDYTELEDVASLDETEQAEIEGVLHRVEPARQESDVTNLLATRRAAMAYARQYRNDEISPSQVSVIHRSDGKPELWFADPATGEALKGIDLSLADGNGMSVAFLATAPIAVDLEVVNTRDAETWRGLLGEDGYALALGLAAETGESFDHAATRVWTILECGRKVDLTKRLLPEYESHVSSSWISLVGRLDTGSFQFLSATLANTMAPKTVTVLTIALGLPT